MSILNTDAENIGVENTDETSEIKKYTIKKGYIICTNDKILGYAKEDFTIPQKDDKEEFIKQLKNINLKVDSDSKASSGTVQERPDESSQTCPDAGSGCNPEMILMASPDPDNPIVAKVNYETEILYVFKFPVSLLNLAQESLKFFTFRRKDRLLKRISPYDNEEFFYGFTTSFGLSHNEFSDYDSVFNLSRTKNFPSSLYYQAGDYSDTLFAYGQFELTECYNRKEYGQVGDLMCGYAVPHEKGPRFIRWFYCGKQFYNLWLLIMFGAEYYVFKGYGKKEILDMLYDSELQNPHMYQAYALVLYYSEHIPDEYGLASDFEDLISQNLMDLLKSA